MKVKFERDHELDKIKIESDEKLKKAELKIREQNTQLSEKKKIRLYLLLKGMDML